MDQIKTNDICVYGPGDLNKFGQSNKTSWDSFSYGIMMGHNVWHHINAVQEANRQYDQGRCPAMLVRETIDRRYFKDIVNTIFSTSNRDVANSLIKDFSSFYEQIVGTRGATGKNTTSAFPMFNKWFSEPGSSEEEEEKFDQEEFTDTQIDRLEELEMETDNDVA
jgi:hypothetical protein